MGSSVLETLDEDHPLQEECNVCINLCACACMCIHVWCLCVKCTLCVLHCAVMYFYVAMHVCCVHVCMYEYAIMSCCVTLILMDAG